MSDERIYDLQEILGFEVQVVIFYYRHQEKISDNHLQLHFYCSILYHHIIHYKNIYLDDPILFINIDHRSLSFASSSHDLKQPSLLTFEIFVSISFNKETLLDILGLHTGLFKLYQADKTFAGIFSSVILTTLPTKINLLLAIIFELQ